MLGFVPQPNLHNLIFLRLTDKYWVKYSKLRYNQININNYSLPITTTMNRELVKKLVEIIHCLSPEEKQLLETELQIKPDWSIIKKSIIHRGEILNQRLNNQSLQDTITNIISEMREERCEELINSLKVHE